MSRRVEICAGGAQEAEKERLRRLQEEEEARLKAQALDHNYDRVSGGGSKIKNECLF